MKFTGVAAMAFMGCALALPQGPSSSGSVSSTATPSSTVTPTSSATPSWPFEKRQLPIPSGILSSLESVFPEFTGLPTGFPKRQFSATSSSTPASSTPASSTPASSSSFSFTGLPTRLPKRQFSATSSSTPASSTPASSTPASSSSSFTLVPTFRV